jgi:hypothetical protein
MFRYSLKFFIAAFFFVGCVVDAPVASQAKVQELSYLLASLDKDISQKEATQLSKDIFYKTRELTEEFEMTSPPQFHNFLVTVGVREKGLCYHWSDALYLYLLEKNYDSFEFHLMGANIGEYLYEHNAMIVVAKGGKIQEGIIIDPWRNAGELYFCKVGDDPKYSWKHRPIRGCD